MRYSSIDEVLEKLDQIIEISVKDDNYLGVFAWVYRRTTAEIKKAIENHEFEDNARMQEFDVVFANYYIDAYDNYRLNRMISQCWQIAFDARHDNLCLLQHILLGMNAHINLDLAVTAAVVMQGKDLSLIRNDFMKVNGILARIVDEMQDKLSRTSKIMFLLDITGGRRDEKLINFSLTQARNQSWRTAQAIFDSPVKTQKTVIREADKLTAKLALKIKMPSSWLIRSVIKLIRRFEVKEVSKVIQLFQK